MYVYIYIYIYIYMKMLKHANTCGSMRKHAKTCEHIRKHAKTHKMSLADQFFAGLLAKTLYTCKLCFVTKHFHIAWMFLS